MGPSDADFLRNSLLVLIKEISADGKSDGSVRDFADVLRNAQRLAVQLYPENRFLKDLDGDPESLVGIKMRAQQIAAAIGLDVSGFSNGGSDSKNPGFDSYLPPEIASRIENAGVAKTKIDLPSTFMLAVLAGAFISLGGIFFTSTTAQPTLTAPFTQLLGGVTFSLGLILVVVAGAELFTGNNLMITSLLNRKVTLAGLLRNWGIAYAGNLLGSVLTAAVLYQTNIWTANGYQYGLRALTIAGNKTSIGFGEAFFLGILCNSLVCLAIWLSSGGRRITEKVVAIVFPISAFVAIGFEHSVANMYFLSFALMIKDNAGLLSAAGSGIAGFGHLDLAGMFGNLVPVTLGNIVGGSVFVGLVYWFIYLRKGRNKI